MSEPLDRSGVKKTAWEEIMVGRLSYGAARPTAKGASSLACLAFVAALGVAFWAGAVWIAETIMRLTGFGL
jgi:hypothetical protein